MKTTEFHTQLKELMDEYLHKVYDVTRKFPKEELYVVTSQLRRATLSVALNYTEGFARFRPKVLKNFLETSYGSLRESRYLLNFALREKYLTHESFTELERLADRITRMLWGILTKL